jgi:hypothetical protein
MGSRGGRGSDELHVTAVERPCRSGSDANQEASPAIEPSRLALDGADPNALSEKEIARGQIPQQRRHPARQKDPHALLESAEQIDE